MAVSLEQIASFLDEIEFKYEKNDGFIRSAMQISEDHALSLILSAPHKGELFELSVGVIISTDLIQASEHRAAFHLYLLSAAWLSPIGTPEIDRDDGELRVLVELPLADALMTAQQLKLCIQGAVQLCHKIRIEGTEVLRTGLLPATAPPVDAENSARMLVVRLIETAQGRVTARAMATNPDFPPIVREIIQKMIPVMDAMDQAEAAPTSI
jgi:hypothetical protein